MATQSHPDSKRKYSWWWDSHISPKNSKWLQENLTDMDAKVKQMIKLIEEDADSFARRAEMYYKKRPELMKLVEEFYRAYRALAERYGHATGALRQAHRTMAEAFPNQVPFDDSSAVSSSSENDPQTPEMRSIFYLDELQKDALGLSPSAFQVFKRNGDFTEEPTVTSRKSLKEPNDSIGSGEAASHTRFSEGKARKGLFQDEEEKEQSTQNSGSEHMNAQVLSKSESEQVGRAEAEILTLKKTLVKLEAEKEAFLLQYQKNLERLSALESEVSSAQKDSKGLGQRASQAEAEVQTLKEALFKLQSERDASVLQYQHCMEMISNLEDEVSHAWKDAGELNERASKTEAEAKAIKQDLVTVEAEKEAAVAQYSRCLETISNLEEKLLHAEENARMTSERADKSETEVEILRQELARLTEEKEAAALQYQQCLETIADLEHKISYAQEEAQRLTCEIDDGVVKLKGAEERCLLLEKSNQTLQSELESLVEKMGSQSDNLAEKQKEIGRLWACIQEERLRFVEAETAFQTLQHLHAESLDKLRSLGEELQNRNQSLKEMETCNQGLEDEIQRAKEENKSLNELNLSSVVSIKNLQDEILSLRETIGKLEEQVELRVDQRNALQQEIYCLREELNELNKKHLAVMGQVESVGYDSECFGSSVKELQVENSKLKEIRNAENSEKVLLLEKLEITEKLLEKNVVLENSLSDLHVELEGVKEKVKTLEESCQALLGEKSTLIDEKAALISQLQSTAENLEKLSEKSNFLENSLFDANSELEIFRVQSKGLEDSYLLLDKEKSRLVTERESLVSQLDITKKRLEDLEKKFTELEHKHSVLENERECSLSKVEELQASLDAAQQEHASFSSSSQKQLADMELQIHVLEEEGQCRKKEYEEQQDKTFCAQMEISILQKSVHDLEEKIISLLIECQNLLGGKSTLVDEKAALISQLQRTAENLEKLSKKNNFLENSLFDANCELEIFRIKSKGLEDSYVLLDKEKSCLVTERESLISQLDITEQRLEDLEKSFTELERKHSELENERECSLTKVEELQASLDAAQQEHASFSISSEKRLLDMELQIHVLGEEGQCRKKEYEEQQDKTFCVQIEIFILQKCVHDLEEKIISLLIQCQNLLEASILSGKLISELEHENLEQHKELKNLFGQMKNLRMGLYQVLKTLEIEADHHGFENKINQDEVLLRHTLSKLKETQNSISRSDDENQQLIIEKSVLVTLLGQLKVDAANLVTERDNLAGEYRIRSEQFSELQMEIQKILGVNEKLRLKVMEGAHRKEVLITETEIMHRQLLDLRSANRNLQEDYFKVIGEKKSLIKEAFDLVGEKSDLEEANWILFGEIMSQSNISLIFNNMVIEKYAEVKELTEELDKLRCFNSDLEEKERLMEGKLEDVHMENLNLKRSLNESENELGSLKFISDQLRFDIAHGKDLLSRKETELLEAEQIFSATANEKRELYKLVEDLKDKYDEAKLILKDQEKQILKLSADNDNQSKEMECAREVNHKLETDLCRLCEELRVATIREESFNSEVQKVTEEIKLWESQAATFLAELQISSVREVLFEGRVHELTIACESLEIRSNCKDTEIVLLKDRVSTMEGENGRLQAQLAAYTPAVISVKNSVSSLEKHTLFHNRLSGVENEKAKDVLLVTRPHVKIYQHMDESRITMVPDEFSDLQDLQRRVEAIEKAVVEMERLAMLEQLNANARLEAAMREIEELKLQSLENVRASNNVTPHQAEGKMVHDNGHGQGMQTREVSDTRNEVLTKDIMLDQISECSSYGISRRETADADQMLQLWETTDRDGSIDVMVGEAQKGAMAQPHNQIEPIKEHNPSRTHSESLLEKELAVDKLEISGRLAEPHQSGNKRKILERLDSDAQKLTNLHITVEDLKRKVDNTEKSRKDKSVQCDTIKGQLDEAEESIMKLFDVNRKLMKTVEKSSLSFDGVSALDTDESVNARRKISDEAQRGSEKIGQLQLEVQKVQFLLLKLDEKEIQGKTRITDRKPKVLLRDYLYAGVRSNQKRKKATFCACVRPPTNGD